MTTAPRIVQVQVVSHRLEVPVRALERLPEETGSLNVRIRAQGDDLVVQNGDNPSRLRFHLLGARAQLAETVIADDDRGLFFQRVLGTLMVRFRGDLHLRLFWNVPDRNTHGDHAEVTIRQGETTYPGLGMLRNVAGPAGLDAVTEALATESEEAAPEVMGAEEQDVERLLTRARAQWAEYQRLRAARAGREEE